MILQSVSSVIFDGARFQVSFSGALPALSHLSTVIGYAKIEQRRSGRTRFNLQTFGNNLLLLPVDAPQADEQTLKNDALVFLDSIGFDTTQWKASSTAKKPRRPRVPKARTSTPRQQLLATA